MSLPIPATDPRIPVQVSRLIDLAKSIQKIDSPETRAKVAKLHAQFAGERRDNESTLKELLAPVLKKERDIRAPFKVVIDTCQLWETYCERQLAAYDREELRKSRERQAALNAKTAEDNLKRAADAEAKGTAPILKATPIVSTVEKTTRHEDGSSNTRKPVKRWTIDGLGPDEDPAKLRADDPRLAKVERDNLVLNITRINKLVAAGEVPAGITVYDDFDYTARGGKS